MAKDQLGTRRDLMLAVWESLDCESVGAQELTEIQRSVAERFGEGAVESPAALARTLADEGAVLRHPEVLEADAKWRERKLSESPIRAQLDFSTLEAASESINELEGLRRELASAGDGKSLRDLRETAFRNRRDLLLVVGSSVLSEVERAAAKEIAGWLEVWLLTPELFADWLELRRASAEFRNRFGA